MLTDCLLLLCHFSTLYCTLAHHCWARKGWFRPETPLCLAIKGIGSLLCNRRWYRAFRVQHVQLSMIWVVQQNQGNWTRICGYTKKKKTSENNNAGLLVLGRDGITTGNFVNLSICEQSHRVRHIGERAVTKNHPQLSHACLFVHVFVTTHASA